MGAGFTFAPLAFVGILGYVIFLYGSQIAIFLIAHALDIKTEDGYFWYDEYEDTIVNVLIAVTSLLYIYVFYSNFHWIKDTFGQFLGWLFS